MPDDVRAEGGLLALVLDELLALRATSDRLEAQQHSQQTVGALLDELRGLRRDVAALRLELRRPADARVAELLVAAFNVAGDAPVSAAYLYELALDDVPGRADLRAALLSVVGREPDGAVRRLGRWLAEHDGVEAEGLRLVRLPGRGRDGTVYRIVDVTRESP